MQQPTRALEVCGGLHNILYWAGPNRMPNAVGSRAALPKRLVSSTPTSYSHEPSRAGRSTMPLGKKRKPSRRAVRTRKVDEESALQELARRVVDEAPAHASVACPEREFAQLPLSDCTLAGLRKGGFSHMTEIQRTSIPHALAGRDLQGGARTGSGKTLAFIVPMLECLYRARWSRMDGLGGLIISPTRELVWHTSYPVCLSAGTIPVI